MNPYRASGVEIERRWNTPAPDMPMLNGPLGGLCALPDWEALRAEPVDEIEYLECTSGPGSESFFEALEHIRVIMARVSILPLLWEEPVEPLRDIAPFYAHWYASRAASRALVNHKFLIHTVSA